MNEMSSPNRYDFRARFQLALGFALQALGADTPADDAQLWYDLLDGETPALDDLRQVVRHALECEAMADALDTRIRAMAARKARFVAAADRCRALVRDCLIDAQLKRLGADDFTASVRLATRPVSVSSPDLLPDALCRTVRSPDLTAIGRALKAGETVPGAEYGEPAAYLAIATR